MVIVAVYGLHVELAEGLFGGHLRPVAHRHLKIIVTQIPRVGTNMDEHLNIRPQRVHGFQPICPTMRRNRGNRPCRR